MLVVGKKGLITLRKKEASKNNDGKTQFLTDPASNANFDCLQLVAKALKALELNEVSVMLSLEEP